MQHILYIYLCSILSRRKYRRRTTKKCHYKDGTRSRKRLIADYLYYIFFRIALLPAAADCLNINARELERFTKNTRIVHANLNGRRRSPNKYVCVLSHICWGKYICRSARLFLLLSENFLNQNYTTRKFTRGNISI